MSMNTVPERLAALRTAMAANGVAVYLIPVGDPHASEYLPDHYTSLTWFSGFHGENSTFVVTRTESALWADGRYFVQAEKEIAGTEIKLQRMGEPGVPTVEEYCAAALSEGEVLGLCGLTAATALVSKLEKALAKKGASIKTLNLEDELWTEGRPALPDTPAWILPKEYAGFSPAEKLDQLRGKLKELGCTAQFVGKLDNLAWLLNLRAMDIECTPYAMAYCYVTPSRAVLFINTARVTPEAKAELEANGITLAEYDDVLPFLAAETEPQTVLAEAATVNYAVYQVLEKNPALTVKDGTDPLLLMKGVKNDTELTEDEKRFYTWTLQSHIDLAKAVWLDYCECKMIDTIAREPLWRHLINYRCGTGHSVSFVGNVHEGPHSLRGTNSVVMRPGMVVTDEPGVYETDLVGIRIENELVCVHKADNQYGTFLGFEPLMFVPIATSPILPGVLDRDEIAWLNDYHRQVFAKLAPHLNDAERVWLAEKCAAISC